MNDNFNDVERLLSIKRERNDEKRVPVPQLLELFPTDLFIYFCIKFRHLMISLDIRFGLGPEVLNAQSAPDPHTVSPLT